jgi:hypothetical protein
LRGQRTQPHLYTRALDDAPEKLTDERYPYPRFRVNDEAMKDALLVALIAVASPIGLAGTQVNAIFGRIATV